MKGPVIGIDLGTTQSLVAAVSVDNSVEVLQNEDNSDIISSVVSFMEKERKCGSNAKDDVSHIIVKCGQREL